MDTVMLQMCIFINFVASFHFGLQEHSYNLTTFQIMNMRMLKIYLDLFSNKCHFLFQNKQFWPVLSYIFLNKWHQNGTEIRCMWPEKGLFVCIWFQKQ